MKYILTFFITFSIFGTALAAAQVPGEVPVFEPLRPTPTGVSAEINGNIQRVDPNFAPAPSPDGSLKQNEDVPVQVFPETEEDAFKESNPWFWWIFVILAIGGLIFWASKNSSKP